MAKSKTPRRPLNEPAFGEDSLAFVSRRFMRGLTPSRVIAIFDAARTRIADQMVLAHELEESDDHLRGTLSLRRKAVGRLDVQIVSGDSEDDRANAAADALREIVARPWFTAASDALLRSIFEQHAAVEIFYDGDWTPTGYRAVEPGRWDFDRELRPRLRRELHSDANWVELTPGQFCWMSYEATAIPGDNALVRAAALLLMLAKAGMKSLGSMIDQWGIPLLQLIYREGMPSGEVQAIVDEMLALAGRRIVATPSGTTVETTDVPDNTPHVEAQEFLRRALSRLLLGQDSSQMAIEGQKTGATLQGNVRDDIRDDDAGLLDAAQNETFVTPWCEWVFGADVAPPRIVRSVKQVRDPVQRAGVFKAAREIGLRIKSEQIYRELDLDMPDDTPEVIEPLGAGLGALGAGQGPENGQQATGNGQAGIGAAPVAAGSVANTGLNGAQITSLTGLLQAVTDKQQSPAVAIELIAVSFPMISREQVKTMVDAAAAFEPAAPQSSASPQSTQRAQSETATVAARTLNPEPRTLLDQAAVAFAQLLAPVREKIGALVKEIDAAGGSDSEKVTALRRRLPELLTDAVPNEARRAELIHKATMAAYARGALQTAAVVDAKKGGA